MPKKRPSNKKSGEGSQAPKPWLPDPKSVLEVKEVQSPSAGSFRILRTNILDPYEKPSPSKKTTRPKRRS